jgi:(p)ppGpp synthase/HD superfamily hydrolase
MSSTARFCEALQYAVQLHDRQRRKGSDIPYIAHLLSVTAIVLEHGGSEDEAIAALLHDAVEDQGGAMVREEILRRFGPVVAAIVDGCSDSETIPKPPWRERKEKYLAHLPAATRSVHLVAAADKLHNVRALVDDFREHGESLWGRFNGGRAGTLWYYRAVADALAAALPGPLVQKLDTAVAELERATVRDV